MTKAYALYTKDIDPYDGNADVVFAANEGAAIVQFCNSLFGYYNAELVGSIIIQRTEGMDKYLNRQNNIPKYEYAKVGFHVDCDNCGATTDDPEIQEVSGAVICEDCFKGEEE